MEQNNYRQILTHHAPPMPKIMLQLNLTHDSGKNMKSEQMDIWMTDNSQQAIALAFIQVSL